MDKDIKNTITYPTLFWLFMFGSIAGFILEGIWCVLRTNAWENHTATVLGPFCIIYGIGAVVFYLVSSFVRGKKLLLQLLLFSIVGALIEYFGSLFQEIVFGSVSWNYNDHFLNINGRISLQMALIWGILGVFFVRFAFPSLVRLMRKLNRRFWKVACAMFSVFMAVNLSLSAAAVMRWKDRLADNAPAANAFEQFLDEAYDNEVMKSYYPNMYFFLS